MLSPQGIFRIEGTLPGSCDVRPPVALLTPHDAKMSVACCATYPFSMSVALGSGMRVLPANVEAAADITPASLKEAHNRSKQGHCRCKAPLTEVATSSLSRYIRPSCVALQRIEQEFEAVVAPEALAVDYEERHAEHPVLEAGDAALPERVAILLVVEGLQESVARKARIAGAVAQHVTIRDVKPFHPESLEDPVSVRALGALLPRYVVADRRVQVIDWSFGRSR